MNEPIRTCARCERRLGILNSTRTRCRDYRVELTDKGVSTVCENKGSCNRAKDELEARKKREESA